MHEVLLHLNELLNSLNTKKMKLVFLLRQRDELYQNILDLKNSNSIKYVNITIPLTYQGNTFTTKRSNNTFDYVIKIAEIELEALDKEIKNLQLDLEENLKIFINKCK